MFIAIYISLFAAVVLAQKGHLKLDFQTTNEDTLSKRQGQADMPFYAGAFGYLAQIYVGSQNVPISVYLDTGSSDLWVMEADVYCIPSSISYGQVLCKAGGAFQPRDSTTFEQIPNAPAFNITYSNTSYARGYYGLDTVAIGSATVPLCTFGIVTNTSYQFGWFGIGLPALEAAASKGSAFLYPNFPLLLKSNGDIFKNVYSLYTNSTSGSSGSVLFGAVDHAKYSGNLQTVPLVNPYPQVHAAPTEFQVVLSSVSVLGPKVSQTITSSPIPVLLSSSGQFSRLPKSIVDTIGTMMLGYYLSDYQMYLVNCDYINSNDYATFNLSGVLINVPFSDLVFTSYVACYLGIVAGGPDPVSGAPSGLLGGNFLRHAYVVYDLDDYEIALAPANYDSNENIEIVTSTIPLAVKAPGYSSTSLAQSVLIYTAILGAASKSVQTGGSPTTIVPSGLYSTNTLPISTSPTTSSYSTSVVTGAQPTTASSTSTKLSSELKKAYKTMYVIFSALFLQLVAYV